LATGTLGRSVALRRAKSPPMTKRAPRALPGGPMTHSLRFAIGSAFTLGVLATVVSPALALDPAVKCEADKLKTAASFTSCLLKADSKAVKKNIPADYSKCEQKLSDKWASIEAKAGGACPPGGDLATVEDLLATCSAQVPGGPTTTTTSTTTTSTLPAFFCPEVPNDATACTAYLNDVLCGGCVLGNPGADTCLDAATASCVASPDLLNCAIAINNAGCAETCCP